MVSFMDRDSVFSKFNLINQEVVSQHLSHFIRGVEEFFIKNRKGQFKYLFRIILKPSTTMSDNGWTFHFDHGANIRYSSESKVNVKD